jgi:hypothetical protein
VVHDAVGGGHHDHTELLEQRKGGRARDSLANEQGTRSNAGENAKRRGVLVRKEASRVEKTSRHFAQIRWEWLSFFIFSSLQGEAVESRTRREGRRRPIHSSTSWWEIS